MTAPTLIMVVRVLYIMLYCPRSDVRWMVTDLGKRLRAIGFWLGMENSAEGEVRRIEHEPIRQSLGYYPRL